MAETIGWSIAIDVTDGPTVSVSPSLQVGGYDLIDVEVGEGDTAAAGVIPATSTASVLMITASRYDDTHLTYDLGSATGIALDGPQLFTGAMIAAAFGPDDPDAIEITNAITDSGEVTVTVLSGRNG